MTGAGAVPIARQEWRVVGIERHERRRGRWLFCVRWAATFQHISQPTEPWGVTQVERTSDTQVLVHWANTWEPSTSLEDADGVRTKAYDDYLVLHPELR
jgi:hypothetical protein